MTLDIIQADDYQSLIYRATVKSDKRNGTVIVCGCMIIHNTHQHEKLPAIVIMRRDVMCEIEYDRTNKPADLTVVERKVIRKMILGLYLLNTNLPSVCSVELYVVITSAEFRSLSSVHLRAINMATDKSTSSNVDCVQGIQWIHHLRV